MAGEEINPTCPSCGHYNAIINGACRDCGYVPILSTDVGNEPSEPGARGRGRPKLPSDQKRSAKLIVSLTEAEYESYVDEAESEGEKVQDWARNVLNKEIQS